MRIRKQRFPRALLKSLVKDIEKFIATNEGRLFLLEVVDDIPYDIKPAILGALSSFYEKPMVHFFHLLQLEFGKEFAVICNRALDKYNMAGMDISPPVIFNGVFYKAFASCSRHTGKLAIDVAWDTGTSGIHVESFYLTFNYDGIHSFFLVDNMSKTHYDNDRQVLADMVELNFEEVCFLVSRAYEFNLRHMNRPALGKFLYQKYLDASVSFSRYQEIKLIRKISQKLTPRQMVNSLFYAFKHQDLDYISSLMYSYQLPAGLDDLINPGVALLEGQVQEVYGSHDNARVTAYAIFAADRKLYRSEYCFYLIKDEAGTWWISDIDRFKREQLFLESNYNPLSKQVTCRVYEILDLDGLFEMLDTMDNIKEIEELPYGIHMRVTDYEADLNHGVTLTSGVIADLVINGEEFVVISSDYGVVIEFHQLLSFDNYTAVVLKGEYDVPLINACNYMSGQYINFEDILLNEDNDYIYEDGMRFISARYLIKDKEQFCKRITNLDHVKLEIPGDCHIYYQSESDAKDAGFFAEYMIGPDWMTISTFGDHDMKIARQNFENRMYDCLEFDGLEVREESLFDVLTKDLKKQYPYLEITLKELYLNKWFHSQLTTLRGMSPSEAVKTEEGTRLLWNMFKKLREKNKQKYLSGRKNYINLKEYIRKVEQKKEKNL